MKRLLLFLLWILVFLSNFPEFYGYPDQLPEIIEATNENSSTCYGTLKQFQPSCNHRPGTVIAVKAVKVGAKRKSLNCPDNVPDDEPRNDTCCSPNENTDCIQIFDYMKSAIPEKYKFHNLCSGYSECIKAAETVWAQSDCGNITVEYMKFTNYLFMEFSCIEESRIGNLCSDKTFSTDGSAFYLQTPSYPNKNISSDIEKCTCRVQAKSKVKVYTLDLRLNDTRLTIADSGGQDIYDGTNATIFNITSTIMTEEIWITLDGTSKSYGAYVWVGFEAINSSALIVSCNVYGIDDSDNEASTFGTVSTTPTATKTVPHKESLSSPTNAGGFAIGIIIGIAVGLLCLIVILMIPVCYLCQRKKRNPDEKRKNSSLMQEDKESDISGVTRKSTYTSRNPVNEKFKPSNIPSNKVDPTRYIEEHGGIRANSVLPHIGRSQSRKSQDQRKEDTHLAPPRYLQPINTSTEGVVKSLNEETSTEHRRKKRRSKHRSHKRKARGENNAQESRESDIAPVNADFRDLQNNDRRHTRKKRHRSHSNTENPDDHYFN